MTTQNTLSTGTNAMMHPATTETATAAAAADARDKPAAAMAAG